MVVPIELPDPPESLVPPPLPPPPPPQQLGDGSSLSSGLQEGEGWMCLRYRWQFDHLAGECARRHMLLRTAIQEGAASLTKMDAAREWARYTRLVGDGDEVHVRLIYPPYPPPCAPDPSAPFSLSVLTQLSSTHRNGSPTRSYSRP